MRSFQLPFILALAAPASTQTTVHLSLPSSVPATAQLVPSYPIGLSIEQDRLPDWAGNLSSPNQYTRTLLQHVADRVGVPPPIRVGGTTEDRTWLAPNSSVKYYDDVFPPSTNSTTHGLYPEATIVYAGTDFWETAGNFPDGTELTFGINIRARDPELAVKVVKKVYEAMEHHPHVKLRAFEIGNEPDMYGNWSMAFFAQSWNAAASAIVNASSPTRTPTFQLFAYANPNRQTNYTVNGAIAAGLAQQAGVKGLAKIASEHHYQGNPRLVSDLMNKQSINGSILFFAGEIAAAKAHGLDFEFGETNSVGGHGAPGVSNVAGAVIWGLDYAFRALSNGITRIYFHNGVCYRYNMFQPIPGCKDLDSLGPASPYAARPHILPFYHILLIAAEAVSYPGAVKVAELDTGNGQVSAYGVWAANSGVLLRVLLINSNAFYSDAKAARAEYTYTFSGLPTSTNGTTPAPFVRRLSIPGVQVQNGLKWAGQSFEGADGRSNGTRVDEPLVGGKVQGVGSEVLVVFFSEG